MMVENTRIAQEIMDADLCLFYKYSVVRPGEREGRMIHHENEKQSVGYFSRFDLRVAVLPGFREGMQQL